MGLEVRLRDRLADVPEGSCLRNEAAFADAMAEALSGLPVLARVHCADQCRVAVLVQDAEGLWPIVYSSGLTGHLIGYGPRMFEPYPHLPDQGYPNAVEAILGLLAYSPPWRREEWIEGYLALAYLDSDHTEVPAVRLMIGLGNETLSGHLNEQRTVQGNLAYQVEAYEAFDQAVAALALDDVDLESLHEIARTSSWIGSMMRAADRNDWAEMARHWVEEWDRLGRTPE